MLVNLSPHQGEWSIRRFKRTTKTVALIVIALYDKLLKIEGSLKKLLDIFLQLKFFSLLLITLY